MKETWVLGNHWTHSVLLAPEKSGGSINRTHSRTPCTSAAQIQASLGYWYFSHFQASCWGSFVMIAHWGPVSQLVQIYLSSVLKRGKTLREKQNKQKAGTNNRFKKWLCLTGPLHVNILVLSSQLCI